MLHFRIKFTSHSLLGFPTKTCSSTSRAWLPSIRYGSTAPTTATTTIDSATTTAYARARFQLHHQRHVSAAAAAAVAADTSAVVPTPPTSHHLHTPLDQPAKGSIIYTETDEAPALATYSLYPILRKVQSHLKC
jgi:hypothetical protein